MTIGVRQLDHLNLTVADLDATERWYADVFEFTRVEDGLQEDGTRWRILRSGEAMLCLYQRPTGGAAAAVATRESQGLNHFSLRITDPAAWEVRAERLRLPLLYGGRLRYPRSTSWYVADPTGYQIEVVAWDGDAVAF